MQGKVSPLSSSSRPPQPSLTTSSSSAVTQLLPTWQPSPLRARPSIPGICPVLDILAYLEFLPCLSHLSSRDSHTAEELADILFPSSTSQQNSGGTQQNATGWRGTRAGAAAPPQELLSQCQEGKASERDSKLTQFLRHKEVSAARVGDSSFSNPSSFPLQQEQ